MFAFAATLSTKLAESDKLTWDMAKEIIQKQYDLSQLGMISILGVAGLLITVQFIYSFVVNKRQLENLIQNSKEDLRQKAKNDFELLEQNLMRLVSEMENSVTEKMQEKIDYIEADKMRLFLGLSYTMNQWNNAALWAANAITSHAKIKKDTMLRTCVDALEGRNLSMKMRHLRQQFSVEPVRYLITPVC